MMLTMHCNNFNRRSPTLTQILLNTFYSYGTQRNLRKVTAVLWTVPLGLYVYSPNGTVHWKSLLQDHCWINWNFDRYIA